MSASQGRQYRGSQAGGVAACADCFTEAVVYCFGDFAQRVDGVGQAPFAVVVEPSWVVVGVNRLNPLTQAVVFITSTVAGDRRVYGGLGGVDAKRGLADTTQSSGDFAKGVVAGAARALFAGTVGANLANQTAGTVVFVAHHCAVYTDAAADPAQAVILDRRGLFGATGFSL